MSFLRISQIFTNEQIAYFFRTKCVFTSLNEYLLVTVSHINIIKEMERLNLVWEQHFPLYACLCVLMASSLLFCGNGLKATNLKLDLSYCRLLQVNAMRTLKFITSPSALGMNSLSWGRQKSCTQRLSRRSHDSTLSSKRLGSSIRSASWEKAKCRA